MPAALCAAQPLLPNSYQPKQNCADSGTPKIQVNPTQVLGQMNHTVDLKIIPLFLRYIDMYLRVLHTQQNLPHRTLVI